MRIGGKENKEHSAFLYVAVGQPAVELSVAIPTKEFIVFCRGWSFSGRLFCSCQ